MDEAPNVAAQARGWVSQVTAEGWEREAEEVERHCPYQSTSFFPSHHSFSIAFPFLPSRADYLKHMPGCT